MKDKETTLHEFITLAKNIQVNTTVILERERLTKILKTK